MAQQLSSSQRRLAQALCADFRRWAPDESSPPRVGDCVPTGLSNTSVLLHGSTQRYVLRIAAPTAPPGIDRHRECALHAAAADNHLAPPQLLCDAEQGLLITAFVGEPVSTDVDAVHQAELLRNIHRLPLPTAYSSTLLNSIDALAALRKELSPGSASEARLAEHAAALRHATLLIEQAADDPVVCHNDLLAANLRSCSAGYLALDWEYAAAGDPFFDLAVSASEYADAGTALLSAYLRRQPSHAEEQRFAAQRLLYAAIDACWRERYAAQHSGTQRALGKLSAQLAGFQAI